MTLILIPFLPCVPTQVEGNPAGVSSPAPRREPCSEIGCDAPATRMVKVPVSGPRGDDMAPVTMPYCAGCAQKPGLEIVGKSDWPCWPVEEDEAPGDPFDANDGKSQMVFI